MTEMIAYIAYCGLTCQTCPIYLATRQKNKKNRQECGLRSSNGVKSITG